MPKITRHGGASNAAEAARVETPVLEVDPGLVAKPARNVRVQAEAARGSAQAGRTGKGSKPS